MKQRLSDYIREELLDGHIYRDLKEDDDLLTTVPRLIHSE